jgi:hypothetical protein
MSLVSTQFSQTALGQETKTEQVPAEQTQSDNQQLISDLTSDSFDRREIATQRLTARGELVLADLQKALETSQDLEQQSRLTALISRIEKSIVAERMFQFILDSDPTNDHGLAAWQPFSQQAGQSRIAKIIFAEMVSTHDDLLKMLAEDAPGIDDAAVELARKVRAKLEGPSLADGLALLATAAMKKGPLPSEVQSVAISCCIMVPLGPRFRDPRWQPVLNQLAESWFAKADVNDCSRLMTLALEQQFGFSRKLARRVLKEKPRDVQTIVSALQLLTQFGTPDDLPLLQTYFEDATLVAVSDFDKTEVHLQDVALATAVILTGQDMREYFAFPRAVGSRIGFMQDSVGFPITTPEKRVQAFEKFAESQQSGDDEKDL